MIALESNQQLPSGEPPSACAHEWLGAIASSVPKKRAALLVT
jgi:hypothetical protein